MFFCCLLLVFFFFFFQAEDGIRDLVRSRGLGDVYKRQGEILGEMCISQAEFARAIGVSPMRISHVLKGARPVTALSLIHI